MDKSKKMTLFSVGDLVKWSPDEGLVVGSWKERYGEPLRVVGVRKVPRDMTTITTRNESGEICHESVGHPQWLVVADKDGRVIMDPSSSPQEFSGLLFIKA